MNHSKEYNFAPLDQTQLEQVKKAETQLNSPGSNEGIILVAYAKKD